MPSTKVLIVDDDEKTRDTLIELLRFEDIEVVGESTFGAAAFTWANQLDVDVVVVTIEEPVARSLRTIEALASTGRSWPVVGVSTRGDRDIMRKAMVSGVRDFVVMPMPAEELRSTIINVHHVERARRAAADQGGVTRPLGTVITVAGFKGGIGKSMVSSNIAVALAQQTLQHVALIDLDLQFGDSAVMLDVVPSTTIEQVAKGVDRLDPQALQGYLATHASRLKLLAAPATPEASDDITDETAGQILEMLAATNDYVVVDTAPHLDGLSAAAMDLSTFVLVVLVPEIPCIRRTKAALTLMQSWGYSRDKVKLVVNRSQKRGAVSIPEIEQVLNYPVYAQIPDDRSVAKSIAVGTPVSMSAPKSRAGRATNDLARTLSGMTRPHQRLGLLRRSPRQESRPIRPTLSAASPAVNGQPTWWQQPTADQAIQTGATYQQPREPAAANGKWAGWPAVMPSNGAAEHLVGTNGNGHHANGVVPELIHAGESSARFPLETGEE
jgi:pilus assembly protein CpaE